MKSDRFAVPGSWAPEGPTTTNQDPASNKAAAMQGTNQLQSLRILFKISGELDRSYTNDPAP
jgi:hypothetical protein